MKKKFLSVLLVICMVVFLVPTVLAATSYAAMIGDVGYSTLADAVESANAGETILLYANVDDRFPTVNKAVTIKGAVEGIEVNAAIAENFPNVDGTVTFENLTFNDRISTEHVSTDQSKMTLKFVNCSSTFQKATPMLFKAVLRGIMRFLVLLLLRIVLSIPQPPPVYVGTWFMHSV